MSNAVEKLMARMASMQSLGAAQRDPNWHKQFPQRDMSVPLEFEHPNLKFLHTQGITDVASAIEWAKRYYDDQAFVNANMFIMGGRDLSWFLSWYLEILEGRVEKDIADRYEPNYYLNSRYGTKIYFDGVCA